MMLGLIDLFSEFEFISKLGWDYALIIEFCRPPTGIEEVIVLKLARFSSSDPFGMNY